MSKLNVVITGATGFVGQHLLDAIDYSKWNVRIVSRNFSKELWVDVANCEKCLADLSDEASLVKAFEGQDVIINIAAEIRDPAKMEASNIEGIKNLIRAAKLKGVKHIVHLSSVGVVGMQYSFNTVLVDEHFPCSPKNKYEETKLVSELLLKDFTNDSSISLCILRPTNVIGEHHPFNALLNLSLQLKKGMPALYRRGAMVNYVYVKDLVEEIKRAVDTKTKLSVWNVGSAISLKDFYELLSKSLQIKIRLVRIPAFVVKLLNLAGIKKLNAISNKVEYVPKHKTDTFGLATALQRTILYYKLN